MGRVASQGCPESPVAAARRPAHVLIVEATSPAGGVSVLPEGVSELLVEGALESSGQRSPVVLQKAPSGCPLESEL